MKRYFGFLLFFVLFLNSLTAKNSRQPDDLSLKEIISAGEDAIQSIDSKLAALGFAEGEQAKQKLELEIASSKEEIIRRFQDYLAKNPESVGDVLNQKNISARLALGEFFADLGDHESALVHFERVRALDPQNSDAWNNIANIYGHDGDVQKAFEYYEKAIELNTTEPIYVANFATTVFLFRKDAREYFKEDEQAVFDRALRLYSKVTELLPEDFEAAAAYASSFIQIKPYRFEAAKAAWLKAQSVASTREELGKTYLELARFAILEGKTTEALIYLSVVDLPSQQVLKQRILRSASKL